MMRTSSLIFLLPLLGLAAACGGDPDPVRIAPAFASTPGASAVTGEAYTYTLTVTGEPAPTVSAADLPAWLTLEGNVLGGTPAEADVGDHTITLTATNGVEPDAVQTFTVNVVLANSAPTFTSTPVTSATEGEQYTYTATATGHPAPGLTATTLPAWLQFENNVLNGTPGLEHGGDHTVVLTATNGVDPDAVQTFTITVTTVSEPPVFTSAPVTAAIEGEAYSYTVAVAGHPAPTLTATVLPAWLTFDAGTGVLSGTPAYADGGEHDVVLTAQNGISPDATHSFSITVATVSTAPQFTSSAPTSATEGQAYSYSVGVSGTPAPTVAATTLPAWLTFNAATGELMGTPAYADGGAHDVVLTAQNGISPDASQAFTITVTTVSTAPLFTASAPTAATEGQLYTFTAATSGTPAPTVTATALPGWLTFDGATGVLSGTPAYADAGNHTVELLAQNGISPDATLAFTVAVTTVSVPPAITSTPVTEVTENAAYSYTVTATGTPAPTLTAEGASGGALPAWLTFDASSGLLAGTPGAADVGAHEVTVTASNGIGQAATQTFAITVEPSEVAPAITSTEVTTALDGQLYSYTVTATGTPAPALSVTLAGGAPLPAWLAFDAQTGVLSGTPAASDLGSLQVEITADNGIAPTATQSFTLTIASAQLVITSTAPTAGQVGTVWTYTVTTSGAPAPTVTVTGLPSWLTFDGVDTLVGVPNQTGTTGTITITAANGLSADGVESFTITVAPMAPIAVASGTYFEGFGTQMPAGWDVAGGVWAFGIPNTGTASNGPPSVFDGAVAATNLTSNYPSNMNARLQTPVFDLTGVTQPVLRFVHWYNFEGSATPTNARYDGGNIKISTDGGATWSALVSGSVVPAYTGAITASANVLYQQEVFTDVLAGGWQTVQVDLGANLDGLPVSEVVLRFDAGSETSVNRPGWFLDNVRVGEAANMNVGPAISGTPPTAVMVGQHYSHTVVSTGTPAPTVTVTASAGDALPAWLTFNGGVLAGTPNETDAGNQPVIITADNGEPPAAVQSVTLAVLPTEVIGGFTFEGTSGPEVEAPGMTVSTVTVSPGRPTTTPGGNGGAALSSSSFHDSANPNYFEFTVTPTAGYDYALAELVFDHYRSGTGPTTFAVSVIKGGVETPLVYGAGTISGSGSWATSYVPFSLAEGVVDTAPVTIRITGGGTTSNGNFRLDNLELRGIARATPATAAITSAPVTTASVGSAYTYAVAASGTPAPTVTVTGRPSWLTYDSATGILSGTPNAAHVGTTGTITVTATNGVGTPATQTFTITVAPAPAVVLVDGSPLVEGFGPAIPAGWGFTGEWEFGTPTTGGSSVGPPVLHDGEVAATRLNGSYSASSHSRLLTPVLDLTGVTAPQLTFMHWYSLEGSSSSRFDGTNLKLSTDGGATFGQLQGANVTPPYTGTISASWGNPMAGQAAWSGTLASWEQVTVDLAAELAGKPVDQVVLRFDLGSDSSTNQPGWYLDDVKIGAAADL